MITSNVFLSDSFPVKACGEWDAVLIGCHAEDELLKVPPAVLW